MYQKKVLSVSKKIDAIKEFSNNFTVLYVQNKPDKTILDKLETLFAHIVVAENEKDAIKEFLKHDISIMIVNLPNEASNAFSTIKKLKSLKHNLFILVLSSQEDTNMGTSKNIF